MIYLTEIG